MQYVVVTGASTGIGYATSRDLIDRGFHVFASVRKPSDAERLKSELGATLTPLLFDVTDDDAITAAAEDVRALIGDQGLFGLVNNAGIAVAGPLELVPMSEIRQQFDINLFGLLSVTRAFLPLLQIPDAKVGRPGRIVNLSSINGIFAAPFLGPYAASKHAVEAVTDSLRRELFVKNVDVIAIGPGVIETPIWDKAEEIDWSPYQRTDYGHYLGKIRKHALRETKRALPPAKVAGTIYKALSAKRPKARYPVVNSVYYEGSQIKVMPKRLIDWLIKKQFRPKRGPSDL